MAIFVNYRREDSLATTGRIADRLRNAFGQKQVYRDLEDMYPGLDFVVQIERALKRCDICVAVIGQSWVSERLNQDGDFVRRELEAFLGRDVPVIPVLADGAVLPEVDDLPGTLKPLVRRQALAIDSGKDFDLHIGRLIEKIGQLRTKKREQRLREALQPRKLAPAAIAIAIAVTTMFCVAFESLLDTPAPQVAVGPLFVLCAGLLWSSGTLIRRRLEARQ